MKQNGMKTTLSPNPFSDLNKGHYFNTIFFLYKDYIGYIICGTWITKQIDLLLDVQTHQIVIIGEELNWFTMW